MDHTSPAPGTRARHGSVLLWVIPVILVVPVPALLLAGLTIHSFRPYHVVLGTVLIALFVAMLYLVVRAMSHDLRTALALTAAWTIVLFTWPAFTLIGRALDADIFLLESAIPVAHAVGILILVGRLADRAFVPIVLTLLTLVIVGATVLDIRNRMAVTPAGYPPIAASVADDAPKPDVIVLILDGYARTDVLASRYGYDNGPFLAELVNRGFVVSSDAFTGYSATWASMSSMLTMGHPLEAGPVSAAEHAMGRQLLGGDNPFFSLFREAGYEITFVENGWDGSNCSRLMDRCVRTGVVRRTAEMLSRLTVLQPLTNSLLAHPFASQSLRQLERLPDVVSETSERPRLLFAHITLPHPPLQVDEDCRLQVTAWRNAVNMVTPEMTDEVVARRRIAYGEEITCLNRLVLEVLDAVPRPDTVIVLTADHGPDGADQGRVPPAEWSDGDFVERMGVLLAIAAPGCPSGRLASPIDAFRRTTDCALGTGLGDIEQRAFFVPGEGDDRDVVDLTDRLMR